ncbi:MAG: DUF2283 domain-containing protein [Candidatus Brocadia sp.]|uniref:DUF2283 domain-containing protein n=1 Tax=Candidatus Brocadia fulgida TaxID=380242 RepID=A0A0M2UVL6_9BACT|nr:MAG: hypothetical protein BROFUL_02254 [Candidatus Brocadia fulgida]MCC6324321.1 DUF2283 domain-containing protein [Candidatus Brocadia sp.]MCE7910429.1 DUF2283 domain-containing protein [Candidatus Brocadia sp. AMX3]MBV6519510.1 hypothetical protein [Candidatus Brocadia fulgida]MDG5995469.1 DUF2283 domain-containing protein [Candidatus Brocadia sp.]
MRIEYDKEADALYIQLKETRVFDNIDIEDGVTIDIDEKGHIIGVEILDATKKLSRKDLSNIIIENLPIEKVETATI